ncbi:MAG: ethanolamine utilization protein [Gammaproteobacteria bacterium]|nr:MAG: ethanolamine utilization protein [Gammaproteobacteria bacterium]
MFKHIPLPCVIVDLETTGCNVTHDRIIEIGIVEVTEEGVTEWSTLINPRERITDPIQRVTGITNEMLVTAPYFEQVAKEILLRLQGKLFVAHNVRFDYGFLRNEYARLAYPYKSKLMCTVKLSRYLYPECDGHSLEKIIARHRIHVTARHRAMEDARATFRFMKIAEEEHGEEKINAAIKHQYRKESLPPDFDSGLIDGLPNAAGVYYFWGENKELLYVGKSINIRKRVMSHFTADHKSSREMKICQQTRNITFDKTAGELSALILEARKVKELHPIYNRKLRRVSTFYSIYLEEGAGGILSPQIVPVSEIPAAQRKLYGLFPSQKKAKDSVQTIGDQKNLCYHVCGLEKPNNRACSSHQLKKCSGYCIGKQSAILHNIKMLEGFSALALKTWPYAGPVALYEKATDNQREPEHCLIVDNWCVLDLATDVENYLQNPAKKWVPQIDRDIYRYLVDAILGKKSVVKILPITTF